MEPLGPHNSKLVSSGLIIVNNALAGIADLGHGYAGFGHVTLAIFQSGSCGSSSWQLCRLREVSVGDQLLICLNTKKRNIGMAACIVF
jgi:hypothetical protein